MLIVVLFYNRNLASHGVKLADWRHKQYGTTIEILVVVLSAGLLKIAFHHVPHMINKLQPKERIMCIRISSSTHLMEFAFQYFAMDGEDR